MRLLPLFSLLLIGCAGKTIYMETPTLTPLYRNTEDIRTLVKTITITNNETAQLIEAKLQAQENFLKQSDIAIKQLATDNTQKQSQILTLTMNESKLALKNMKLYLAVIITSLLLLGSIALRFINFKIL